MVRRLLLINYHGETLSQVPEIGHFTVVCSVPWPLNRREAGSDLVCYKPSCFSNVNGHVHGLVSMRIPRFTLEKQAGL